jgi:hypothetical protein
MEILIILCLLVLVVLGMVVIVPLSIAIMDALLELVCRLLGIKGRPPRIQP